MIRYLFVLFAAAWTCSARSQTTTPSLVSTAGDHSSNAEYSLQWSLGDVAVQTLTGEYILTQGFHQGSFILSGTEELVQSGINVTFYPNPVKGILHIHITNAEQAETSWRITIHDLNGRLVLDEFIQEDDHSLDMTSYPPGIYLFNLRSEKVIKKFKIVKQD